MTEDERRQLAELERGQLEGNPAQNPHVMELRRRQAAYPQKPVNALAEFFGSKDGPRLHGRKISPKWWK
jgi:hypothetical protein